MSARHGGAAVPEKSPSSFVSIEKTTNRERDLEPGLSHPSWDPGSHVGARSSRGEPSVRADMAAGHRRCWRTSVLLSAVLAGPAWGDEPFTFEDRVVAVVRSTDVPATITVIRLHHAKAEELAATLRRALPPDVTVVPDVPTNSLIISVPGASLVEPMDSE